MKNLLFALLILLYAVVAFGTKDRGGYRPMVTEGEIITVYSVDDPKRLPSVEEVRSDLKKKKNMVKEGVDDQKPEKDTFNEESESDQEEDESSEDDESEESEDEGE